MRLNRVQVKIATVVLTCTVGLTGVSAIFQFANHFQDKQELRQSAKRVHFWRVVAGQEPGASPTVDNVLAKDLRDRLGEIDPNATSLPQPIQQFRGNSNAYGGITDALSFDPFEETGLPCNECGPLDSRTQESLLLIKQGRLSQVVAREAPIVSTGYTLTPWGMGVLVYGLLWAVALSAFFFGYPAWRLVRARSFSHKIRSDWPDYAAMLDEVDEALERIPERYHGRPNVIALHQTRDQIIEELHNLSRAKEDGDLDYQLQQAEQRMSDLRDTLTIRKEVAKELESA